MNENLLRLIAIVGDTDIPVDSELFGGARLIITSDPNRSSRDTDTVVLSDNASTLSWFVFELKKSYGNELNTINKYEFYQKLGELLNESIELGISVREQMQYVLHHHRELEATLD